MDKFHVGQMVKIVKAKYIHELVGTVCKIISPRREYTELRDGRKYYGYDVDVTYNFNGTTYTVCPLEEHLAPIYDGNTPTTWAESAWKPRENVSAQ